MEAQLLTLLAILGAVCVTVAAFATDWRLGLAVAGAVLLAVAVRLEATSSNEPPS